VALILKHNPNNINNFFIHRYFYINIKRGAF
jgi:hypothetical protein